MTITRRKFVKASVVSVGMAACAPAPSSYSQTPKTHGDVVGQREAAVVGRQILEQGGNAVDAMVAASLVACVVALPSTGIGGYGGVVIVGLPGGKLTAIDMNTAAPKAMQADQYVRKSDGSIDDRAHMKGWTSVGVPGILAGLESLHKLHGSMPLADLMAPAIEFAEKGFVMAAGIARAIKTSEKFFSGDPGSSKLYLRNGKALASGETFTNPDLARMLRDFAHDGTFADFYRGKVAAKIAQQCQAGGGWLTTDDMAEYKATRVEPIAIQWRGLHIHTLPPTAGGLTALQTIRILDALNWPNAWPGHQADIALVESLRIAWNDRLNSLGDPKFVNVPIERLLSEAYAIESADRIRQAIRDGKPLPGQSDGRTAGGTIHLNAVDKSGMFVAHTFTHGDGFGAGVTVDGLGLTLGHGLSRFDPRPGRANSPGPGKRPLHNMCPTILMKDDAPIAAVGGTGGRRIVSAIANVLAQRIGGEAELGKSLKAVRVHCEGDVELLLDKQHPAWSALEQFGYHLTAGSVASVSGIERQRDGTLIVAP